MKSFTYPFLALLLSNSSFAVEIPNHFEDGQVTSASQMNENFQAIKAAINALNNVLPNVVAFQGYSAPIAGTAGVHAFASACEAVSTGSRICTGDELTLSPSSDGIIDIEGHAWIAREISQANIGRWGGRYDNYGSSFQKEWHGRLQSCASGNSHTIQNGRFSSSSCDNSHPIACCK